MQIFHWLIYITSLLYCSNETVDIIAKVFQVEFVDILSFSLIP